MEIVQRLKNAPVTKGSICHITDNVNITVAKDVEMEIAWRLMFAIVIKDIQWWMMSANQFAQGILKSLFLKPNCQLFSNHFSEDAWMDFVQPLIHVNVLEAAGLSTLHEHNA